MLNVPLPFISMLNCHALKVFVLSYSSQKSVRISSINENGFGERGHESKIIFYAGAA